MTILTLSSTAVQNPELLHSELEEYTMLMSLEAGKFFSINPVGSRIWARLEQPTRLGDIQESLLDEFDVPPDQCQTELLAFIQRLAEEDLVKVCD